MRKAETGAEKPSEPKGRSRRMIAMAGGALVVVVALGAGVYAATQPGGTETAATAVVHSIPVPMPVATVADAQPPSASDYEIVSIYEGEAILAAGANLIRVKVGSVAPAIGTVLEVTQSGAGGAVVGTEATLRTL